jgi:putative MATE family efflux protein
MEERLNKNPMGYENILPLLIKMSLPIMLSMLIQSLYNITDSYFVSKISEKALRATSLAYPIQIIIIGFSVGTGIGINSFISRALGSGKQDRANKGAMHGLLLVLFSWAVFLIFRVALLERFLDYFTSDPVVKAMGIQYLGLITTFSVFSILQITIEKIIQGTGNMVLPMIIQGVGAITNIILDPIMIFGLFGFPAMGIRGAAIATLIGQAFGALLGVVFLLSKKISIEINFRKFKYSPQIIKDIYIVGFPSVLMQSVTALVTTILNLIVLRHSELAVSVLGIYFKLESFILMPVFGLTQGVLPLIGYNYGAKVKERINETYHYGVIFALILMGIGTAIFQLFPRQLMGIFSDNSEMIEIGVYALRIISIGYLFAAIGIINSTYFQALGLGNYSLLITSLRQIIIIIPLAYALSFIGLNWIWLAYPIAEVLTTIVSVALQKKSKAKYIDIL